MDTTRVCRKCGTEPLPKYRQVCDACNSLRDKRRNESVTARFGGLYWVWNSMNQRCTNTKHKVYHRYGGRGITVCKEWRNSFAAFYEWAMASGQYQPGLQLDRENNNGNYEPGNCRFVTSAVNIRNQATTKFTEAGVAVIKRRLLDGESEIVLASEFNCSRASIRGIRTGKRWGDVKPSVTAKPRCDKMTNHISLTHDFRCPACGSQRFGTSSRRYWCSADGCDWYSPHAEDCFTVLRTEDAFPGMTRRNAELGAVHANGGYPDLVQSTYEEFNRLNGKVA